MKNSRKELDHDFDLNITSIVDCFTVLITYLLAAASFISLGMLPAESLVSSTASTGAQMVDSQVQLTVEILESHKIRFSVWTGNESQKKEFSMSARAPASQTEEEQRIDEYVTKLKTTYPQLEQAIVASDSTVSYGDYVRGVELVKRKFKIYLANGGK